MPTEKQKAFLACKFFINKPQTKLQSFLIIYIGNYFSKILIEAPSNLCSKNGEFNCKLFCSSCCLLN